MARLDTRKQVLLLVAAASVPVSLGLTAWPPAAVHDIVVVHTPVAVPVAVEVAAEQAPASEPPAAPAPVEVELIEVTPQPAGFVYGRDFLWVTHDVEDGRPFAVLSLTPDEAWGTGEPRATEEHGLVIRELDETAVPAELRAMVGERVVVHGGGTPVCTAEVGPLRLVAQAEGELYLMLDSLPAVPAGEGDAEPGSDAMPLEEDDPEEFWTLPEGEQNERVVEPIWRDGRRLLVAPLTLDGACDDGGSPRWARPVRRGDVERLEASRMRSRSLVREFLALPELVELSREFDDYVAGLRQYEEEEAAAAAEAGPEPAPAPEPTPEARPLPRLSDRVKGRQWRTAEGTPAFVTMITEGEELMPEPCSGIPAPRWAIAPLDAEGKPGALVVGPYGMPSAILDLEGDAQWELLMDVDSYFTEPELLTITPEGLKQLSVLPSVPYWGCPC